MLRLFFYLLLFLLNRYCDSRCSYKFKEIAKFPYVYGIGANTTSACQNRCLDKVLCEGICWNAETRVCYTANILPNHSVSGSWLAPDTCTPYKVDKVCHPGCFWKKEIEENMYQAGGEKLQGNFTFDECREACIAKPRCVAIDWGRTANCSLHSSWGTLSYQNGSTHVNYKEHCPDTKSTEMPTFAPPGYVLSYFFLVFFLIVLVVSLFIFGWVAMGILTSRPLGHNINPDMLNECSLSEMEKEEPSSCEVLKVSPVRTPSISPMGARTSGDTPHQAESPQKIHQIPFKAESQTKVHQVPFKAESQKKIHQVPSKAKGGKPNKAESKTKMNKVPSKAKVGKPNKAESKTKMNKVPSKSKVGKPSKVSTKSKLHQTPSKSKGGKPSKASPRL